MADASRVTVYTTEPCGFCRQAKALLEARGIDFDEVNLAKDPDGRADLVAITGQMTFPQIADRPSARSAASASCSRPTATATPASDLLAA